MDEDDWRYTTLEAKNSRLTMVKPGELVDVVEISPLTLADRRIYNLLIRNAWDRIGEPVVHCVNKSALRGPSDGDNVRVGQSIERLMGAIVRVRIERDGQPATRRIQILGVNDEEDRADGVLHYSFPAELREIIVESNVFARLRTDVIFAFSSKYALALYELVQKRCNLSYKHSEEFTLDELRGLFGIPKGKLKRYPDLNKYAIQVATREVNALSDHVVHWEPIRTGRFVTALRMTWFAKTAEARLAAYRQLHDSRGPQPDSRSRSADLRGTPHR